MNRRYGELGFHQSDTQTFCPGIPGIRVTQVVGDYATTIDEFKQIHDIFTKYADLSVLTMEEPKPLLPEEELEHKWEREAFEEEQRELAEL